MKKKGQSISSGNSNEVNGHCDQNEQVGDSKSDENSNINDVNGHCDSNEQVGNSKSDENINKVNNDEDNTTTITNRQIIPELTTVQIRIEEEPKRSPKKRQSRYTAKYHGNRKDLVRDMIQWEKSKTLPI